MKRAGAHAAVGSLFSAIVLLGFHTLGWMSNQDGKAERRVSFSKDLAPIIKRYCIACHSREDPHPSNLYFDTYEDLMGEGKHGRVVIPRNAKESILYRKLLPNPPFGRVMPPSRRIKLSEDQIETFRRWIDQGAHDN